MDGHYALDVGRREGGGGVAVLKRKTVLLSTGSTGKELSAESRSHGPEVPEPVEAFRIQVTERENERWRFTAAWKCTCEGGYRAPTSSRSGIIMGQINEWRRVGILQRTKEAERIEVQASAGVSDDGIEGATRASKRDDEVVVEVEERGRRDEK